MLTAPASLPTAVGGEAQIVPAESGRHIKLRGYAIQETVGSAAAAVEFLAGKEGPIFIPPIEVGSGKTLGPIWIPTGAGDDWGLDIGDDVPLYIKRSGSGSALVIAYYALD